MSTKKCTPRKIIKGQKAVQHVVRPLSESKPLASKRKLPFNHNLKTNSTKKELQRRQPWRSPDSSDDQDSCVLPFAQIAGPDEPPNSAQISAREQEVAPATPPPSQESPGGPDRNAPFFTPGETGLAGCNSSDQEDDQYVRYPASLAGEKPYDIELLLVLHLRSALT